MSKKMPKNKSAKQLKDAERPLDFELTTEERAKFANQMADYDAQIADEEAAKDAAAKSSNAKIKDFEEKRQKISAIVRAGKETRVVKVKLEFDFDAGQVRTLYKNEVKETRAMTPDERQLGLKLKDKKAPKHDARKAASGDRDDAPEAAPPATSEVQQAIRDETSKLTKHSAVDGPRTH